MATLTRSTLEQFLDMPDTKPASEYVCGEVVQKPMPDEPHAFIQGFLFHLLFQFLTQHPLGRAGTEWRCVFGPPGFERAWVPDLAYASFARLPRGDARAQRFLRAAPDLAIEILSPGQSAGRFADKLLFYLANGVRLVWVIDPADEVARVYAPGAQPLWLVSGDSLDGGDMLPGFSVPAADILAQLQV